MSRGAYGAPPPDQVWQKRTVIARSERDNAIHSGAAALDCFAVARNDEYTNSFSRRPQLVIPAERQREPESITTDVAENSGRTGAMDSGFALARAPE